MNSYTNFLLRFLILGLLPACFARAARPEGTPHVFKVADGRELKLYVSKPPGWMAADARPAIVFFHGGGFVGGNAGQFAGQCEYLASRGMVAITAEYRLLSKDRRKAPLVCNHDAKSAMRWVRSHAGELGIDPERIAAGGGSAGGHLAAFVGLVDGGDDPADDRSISTKVAALVLFNPAIAWPEKLPLEGRDSAMFSDGGEEFLKLAPANFLSRSAPPTLILSGEKDPIVPMSYLQEFQRRMGEHGVHCETVFYKGQGHAFFNPDRDNGRFYTATLLEVDRFLCSLGWIQGPATLKMPEAVLTIRNAR
ncbi:MAG: alpha/beta hydrolase fold domain-containing protein [Opitutaceae bacterium]|nr:alpha/beta hydrolase fold domain-containing protein [Opitutaceae bacterium]